MLLDLLHVGMVHDAFRQSILRGLQAKNEVKVLNSLNHPNIVKYYECYQERNMMHIIMEFCQVSLPPLLLCSCSCMKCQCVQPHCMHCHC